MVYSSLWRKAKKGAWALIVTILIPNLVFAEYAIHLSSFTLQQKHSVPVNGYVKTDLAYNESHGVTTGTREIKSAEIKDESRYVFKALTFSYLSDYYNTSLSLGENVIASSLGQRFWFLDYGIVVASFKESKHMKIKETISQFYCVVRCSYVSTLTSREHHSYEIKSKNKKRFSSLYLGLFYVYESFDINLNYMNSYTEVKIGYQFN